MNWGWTYSLIMLGAVGTGIVLSRRTQQSLGLTWRHRLGIGLGAFCGSMIGAKLPFVLSNWSGFLSGAAWFENGKTIVFGLVGGYFGVELAKWALDIKIKTGDSFATPVAASVAIGRLACFVGGCCYGSATSLPWGVDFGDGVRRHPTQLYEFIFHLGSAIGLSCLFRRQLLRGQLIKLYIIAYLVYRFLTEYIRPEPILWFGLTGYQLSAAALVPIFAILWLEDSVRFRERHLGSIVPTDIGYQGETNAR
jgi:phosphatidylglycerol---prolipoprotein diacylglyceryl transferase